MGEEQTVPYDQLLRDARERFESADDLTVAIEEEFALLDPVSLDLVNRFEEVRAAAAGTPLAANLAGELIASEVEVKTGKQPTLAAALAALPERRAQIVALVEPLGLRLGTTGTHPWASWKDQRIIDTPHYRRNDEILRYVAWKNTTFGFHVHVGIRGADRAIRIVSALRNWLPELLALSASSPFAEDVDTGLHSARTQIFTRFFPRCGVPDAFAGWDDYERYVRFLYETRSIDEHTQIWWSVRPHLSFPTVEVRICDAQPDVGEAQALAAFTVALVARIARALDDGETLPSQPHRLIEENLWRAIRYGLSGELEWVAPVADELDATSFLAVPAQNAAERQLTRLDEGDTLKEIYGALVVGPARAEPVY